MASTAPDPAPQACPKCGTARRGERACPRCGLTADRMAAFAERREAAVAPAVQAAWSHTLEAWDDAGRHDALFIVAAQHDAYAWVAARYREAKRARPLAPSPFRTFPDHAIDAIADRALERMQRAAEATLFAGASARAAAQASPYRATKAVLAMLIFAIVAGLLFTMVLRRNKPAGGGSGTTTPAEPAQRARPK